MTLHGYPYRPVAAVAVRGGQLVKVSGDDAATPTTAIADEPVAVVVIDAAAGAGASVNLVAGNSVECLADGAITAGAIVEPSPTVPGAVRTRTSGTRVGIATSTAAGGFVRVAGGA